MPSTRVLYYDNLKIAGASGNIALVDPRRVSPGTEPPGPFPPPTPVVGEHPFGMWDLPSGGAGVWNSTVLPATVSGVVSVINKARATGQRLFLIPGGTRTSWNPRGRFYLSVYLANINALYNSATARAAILAALADGTIFAWYILDEPQLVSRYGRVISEGEVKEMCDLTQLRFPNSRMFIRKRASDVSSRINSNLGFWLQYAARKGDLQTMLAQDVAACQAFNNAEMCVGLNVIHWTSQPNSNIDTFTTPTQYITSGRILAEHPYPGIVGFMCWKFQNGWYNQSGMPARISELANIWHAAHP